MKRSRPVTCLVAVISLLLGVIWHSPATAAAAPVLQPLGLIDVGQVIPSAIDVDASGNIYVVDQANRSVVKLNPHGSVVASFLEGFPTGRGLAVNAAGSRLFVAGEHEVAVFDLRNPQAPPRHLTGSAAPRTPEFLIPAQIDLDRDGYVFVADSGTMEVKVYDAAGTFQYAFGGRGAAAGQFKSQTGLAVDVVGEPQRSLVADRSLERVQAFSLAGQVQSTQATATAFGPTALLTPAAVVFDTSGRSYFLDAFNGNLRVLDPALGYLATYATAGLETAKDLAFDGANRRLLVACEQGVVAIGVDGGQNPVPAVRVPEAPMPLSPVAGSVVAAAAPTLQFAPPADAAGLVYEVQVLAAGAVVYSASAVTESAVTVPAGVLAENATYAWQVRATNGEVASAWSDAESFSLNAVPEAPSAPVLVAPLAGETLAGFESLRWEAATDPDPGQADALTYRVSVASSADPDFTALQYETSAADLALADLPDYATLVPGQLYTWQVSAVDPDGQTTPSVQSGSFLYRPPMVTVTANVPDARVYLGGNAAYAGRFVGTAPVEVRDLPAGSYSVVVERAGMEPFLDSFEVLSHQATAVTASMTPALVSTDFTAQGLSGVTGEGDAAPCVVDFDNDGHLDLLLGDAAGVLQLFPGIAGASPFDLGPGIDLGLVLPPAAVPFVADWNNDDAKDLLVGSFDGTVQLFLNQGSDAAPSFGAGENLATPAGVAVSVAAGAVPLVADLDGDSDKDLVVGSSAGQLVLFRNTGSDAAPELAPAEVLVDLPAAVAPLFIDWNGNGSRELLATASGGLYPVLPQADGSWAQGQPLAVPALGSGQRVAAVLDIDGSGGKDLVVGTAGGGVTLQLAAGVTPVVAFQGTLADKIAALRGDAADAGLDALLPAIDAVAAAVGAGDFAGALTASDDLLVAAAGTIIESSALELNELLANLP